VPPKEEARRPARGTPLSRAGQLTALTTPGSVSRHPNPAEPEPNRGTGNAKCNRRAGYQVSAVRRQLLHEALEHPAHFADLGIELLMSIGTEIAQITSQE